MTPDEAAAAADMGRPSAVKRGRNPRFPYVPIVDYRPTIDIAQTEQIRAKAFATRAEAVEYAEQVIARRRRVLAGKLARPNYRALRAHHGITT